MTHEAFEKWLLDLVAIATVADMVPLRGESRTFTKYGLIVLKKTRRIGLEKLLLEAKLKHNDGSLERIDEDTIGFKIAPMINAAGRLHHANVAYNLLTTEDPIAAVDLAYELKSNNQDRKKITDKFVAEAIEQVEATQQDKPVLLVKSHDWTTGVVGLIASRLKAEYHKPTVAIAWNGDAITGSGRSIPGFNMVEAIQGMPELFTKFGGHPMACGFTLVDEAALAQFQDRLIDAYYEATRGAVLEKTIDIETELTLEDINWDLYDELVQFEPFGKENPKPLYLVRGATVKEVKALGKSQSHLALFLTQHTPKIKKFIGWRMCSTSTGTNWCTTLKPGDRVDVVFDIGINEWNGNRDLQCIIQDLRISND
jgi:single-stranded-DNA-specific exonuclease